MHDFSTCKYNENLNSSLFNYNTILSQLLSFRLSSSGHHTLGRLPSQQMHASALGPNNGKYATLSKQCKTLEANDFY